MTTNPFPRALFLSGFALLSASVAVAQSARSLSGFDVLNTSDFTAHSFEAEYDNLAVNAYLAFDTNSYANAQVTATQSGSVVRWTDGATPSGSWSHFGLSLDENPPQTQRAVRYSYSPDRHSRASVTVQTWEGNSSMGFEWIDRIVTTGTIAVQRRVTTWDGELSFADLTRGGELWNQGILIDDKFVEVPPDGLTYQYPAVASNVWNVMMFDVRDLNTGIVDLTFVNAVQGRICLADFDDDGFVTGIDYDLYVSAFEAGDMAADFDDDGFITGIDFDLYVQAFEVGC